MRSMSTILPTTAETMDELARLMASYPCYAYVGNAERTGARALFRGRWRWEDVRAQLAQQPTTVVLDDERASGYTRYRLYAVGEGGPLCLAEVEIYFARGEGRTTFWCEAGDAEGRLALAA
ncbi:MAG: hypothetical protein VKP62_04800 [Candidatus Sericytochromatia bacterium]|nr:hypothetical protein [Candidatus Sericytochromatia bacterium]